MKGSSAGRIMGTIFLLAAAFGTAYAQDCDCYSIIYVDPASGAYNAVATTFVPYLPYEDGEGCFDCSVSVDAVLFVNGYNYGELNDDYETGLATVTFAGQVNLNSSYEIYADHYVEEWYFGSTDYQYQVPNAPSVQVEGVDAGGPSNVYI